MPLTESESVDAERTFFKESRPVNIVAHVLKTSVVILFAEFMKRLRFIAGLNENETDKAKYPPMSETNMLLRK